MPPAFPLSDNLVTDVELDCVARRWRLLRSVPLYLGVASRAVEVAQGRRAWLQPWPGSVDAWALEAACDALGRQPPRTPG